MMTLLDVPIFIGTSSLNLAAFKAVVVLQSLIMLGKLLRVAGFTDCCRQTIRLVSLGDMRPGSLSTQSRSWGGRYCQLSYTHRGRGHTEYIKDDIREQTQQQLQNYKKFKALTLEWVDRAIELAKIKAQLKKEKS
jgi:hypothetical protein